MINKPKIKVMVVDDSIFMRRLVKDLFKEANDVEVIGTASDGLKCLEQLEVLRPDVITLDIEMPRLNGLETLKRIMAKNPLPVVMLSSLTSDGAAATMQALEYGAIDFVHKPSGSISLDISKVKDELLAKVRAAALVKIAAVRSLPVRPKRAFEKDDPLLRPPRKRVPAQNIVAIGSSTGGPRALMQVISDLPADLPAGVVIVQHMPVGFTKSLADRLDSHSGLSVREAQAGDKLYNGVALLAPGGYHLTIKPNGTVALDNKKPPVVGLRPTVDLMMETVAPLYRENVVGVILTGMGHDGTSGMEQVKKNMGRTIAEDKSTAIIYGMPRSIVEHNLADFVMPLPQIGAQICKMCGMKNANR